MILLIFIFCHSIWLVICFTILKDGLALYKKIRKKRNQPKFCVANQEGHIPAQRRDLMPGSSGAFAASKKVITFL